MKVAGSILAFEATNYVLYTYFIGNYNLVQAQLSQQTMY
jgi:hypothetical protein|nr:MAG TPA: DNA binding protein [Caudoviricetes sp.]